MKNAHESATFYFERQRYREAIEHAQPGTSEAGIRIPCLYLMGLSALHLEDMDLVKSSAGAILAEAPDAAHGHDLLGYYRWELGELDQAERHLREAIRLGPEEASRFAGLAQLVSQKRRLEDAITIAHQGLEVDPQSLFVLTTLQRLYRLNKQPRLAERMEKLAEDIDPESAENHLEAGFRLLAVGQQTEASGRLREALRLDPTDSDRLKEIATSKVANHPVFRIGIYLHMDWDLLFVTLLIPLFWYGVSLLWSPVIYIAWLSVAMIAFAFAHRLLFRFCCWWTLRQLRTGRL